MVISAHIFYFTAWIFTSISTKTYCLIIELPLSSVALCTEQCLIVSETAFPVTLLSSDLRFLTTICYMSLRNRAKVTLISMKAGTP